MKTQLFDLIFTKIMTEIYINNFEEFIDPGLIKNDVFHVVSLMKYISEKGLGMFDL